MKIVYLLCTLIVCCSCKMECIKSINQKVLLNAESFGFGPAAAIAQFFPYLREEIEHLSYIGTGHTLDLQVKLPYTAIYDYNAPDINTKKAKFDAIAQNYDVFITALDFQAAEWAKELGLKVIIYDPLTWYWSTIPSIIKNADLYIAQNFFGVAERVKSQEFPVKTILVPPIVKSPSLRSNCNDALINLGGLFNPFIENKDLINFAKILLHEVNDSLSGNFDNIYYTSNQTIAREIKSIQVNTLQPAEVQDILKRAKLVMMTPGLGNIYEAAITQKYVIWLPPANDSQGQQLKLLRDNNMVDYAIDWHEILDDEKPIDYFAPQEEVLKQIASYMQRISENSKAQDKLRSILADCIVTIKSNNNPPLLSQLIETFGQDGARIVSDTILQSLHS